MQVPLHLLLQVIVDGMVEQFFPADALCWLGFEHFLDQVFAHGRNGVDLLREDDVLLQYHVLEFYYVLGVEWGPT